MAPTNKLSGDQRDRLVQRVQAGDSYRAIAEELGVSVQAVSFHARKAIGPKNVGKISEGTSKEIAARFLDGERATALAEEFGLGLTTVRAHIERQTGSKPGRNRRKSGVNPPSSLTERAYLAALVDGEGCISVNNSGGHTGWQVTITNTSEELRSTLSTLGGRFYFPKRQKSSLEGKEFRERVWVWKTAAAWDVHRLLVAIEPFMRIKRDKARRTIAAIEAKFGRPPAPTQDSLLEAGLLVDEVLQQTLRQLVHPAGVTPPLRSRQISLGI